MYRSLLVCIILFSATSFSFSQAPTITSFTPASGPVGTIVTITGTNFSTTPANNTVKFNNVTATVTASTATSITTTVPLTATTGTITGTVGAQTGTSAAIFTVSPPSITSFTPTQGIVGSTVTITGTNFSTTPATNIVKFNNVTATVTASTATSITTTVPATATTGPITVAVGALTTTSSTNFKVCPQITITVATTNKTSFSFSAAGGQDPYTYALDGVNFLPATSYTLTPGTYSVTAKDANGCTGTSDFKINGIVDCGVTQASGGQGTSFTTHILGSGSGQVEIQYQMYGIPDQMEVYYDNQLVATTNTLVSNQGTLKFNYTFNPLKPIFCVIKMYAPNSGTAWDYAALCPDVPTPKITSFSPNYGNIGTSVTILGSNFSAGTVVKFGTITASSPVINGAATQITVNVPAGAVSAPISVSNVFGSFTTLGNFTISPYCLSSATSSADTRIDKVVFNNIDNTSPTSTCETFTDYSNLVAYLSAGQTYDLKVTLGTCGGTYNKAARAFIDWNGDSDFADAGEIVATSTASGTTTREETFSVAVPASLSVTTTRMRIVVVETATPTSILACGTYSFGETEDYSINFITAGTPSKNISPAAIPAFEAVVNYPSGVRNFIVTGTNLVSNAFTVTAPTHFQVSAQPSTGFGNSIVLTPVSGSVNARVYVRYSPTIAGNHSGNIAVTNTLFSATNVAVSGQSTAAMPTLLSYALFDDFVSALIGTAAPLQTFRLDGSYLTGNVIVTAPPNFQLSLTTTYTSSLTLTPIAGEIQDQIIKVRYVGASAGPHSGNIVASTTGLSNQNFPVYGLVVPTAITGFSPGSGIAGATVTITGTNFSATTANNVVKFNNVTAVSTASTATSITTIVPATATTGPITVTVGGQTATSTSNFTVIPPTPTITSFTPVTGAVGTSVTITGTNFSATPANNLVKFNTVTAIVTASTPTSITTTVPAGATTGSLTVTVAGQTSTSSSNFTVIVPTPTITSFSPVSGTVGATVTITGTNFSTVPANNTVKFNNVTATVTASTATSITTTVPAGATNGTITVNTGGTTATSTSNFTVVIPPPTITSFNPASGGIGATVTITGTNFSSVPANNTVKFFNNIAAVVTASTSTSITTTVPSGSTTGAITVTVGSLTATSSSFTVIPPPTISNFTPTSGAFGASVTINGANFSTTAANNIVKFNNTTATVISSTATSITTTVPVGATTGTISVTVGTQTATSSASFTVTTPIITSFTPASGIPGTTVSISGFNFSTTPANNVVKFNNTTAVVTGSTATSITTTVPAGAPIGAGTITVTLGSQTATSSTTFTVISATQPTVTSFTPSTGSAGTSVVITGTNFSSTPVNNIVKFNNTTAPVSSSTSTSITATVPSGATSGPITVTVGLETGTSSTSFTVTAPPPIITDFTPTSGGVGAIVAITGTNFSATPGDNTVRFNGVAATVTASNATSITTTVPTGATTGAISIAVGGQTVSSSTLFTVTTIAISSFTPATGPVGTTVVINGSGFDPLPPNNLVKFNGTTTVVSASTAASITTTVPVGAVTGPITVTVGGQTVTSASDFVITLPVPVITSFSPASGLVGASITINGINFDPTPNNNIVKFNNTVAEVSASTATSITTKVPVGATNGSITVTVNGLTGTSSTPFNVIIPIPSITSFSPTSGPPLTLVTITGINFSTLSSFNQVYVNNASATVNSSTTTSIVAIIPSGATSGKIEVKIGNLTATSTDVFTVLNCTIPPKPTISATALDTESPVLTSSSNTGNQWFLNGTAIANATGKTLTVATPGVYKVQVTATGGCISDFSTEYPVIVTGDTSLSAYVELHFYPNPVQTILKIEIPESGTKSISLFNSEGRLMRQSKHEGAIIEVDVSEYASGVHYFMILSEKRSYTGKFLKKIN